MSVGVPSPVAPISRVSPCRLPAAGVRAWVTPVPKPSAASAALSLLVMDRSAVVPVWIEISPLALIEDGVVAPVIWSIADRMSCTVPVVLMVPPLALVLVGALLLKVMVLPSTIRLSPLEKPLERAGLAPAGVPDSRVPVVSGVGPADVAAVWVTSL